jgi:uncharacterized protein (DUF58 family)
MSPLPRIGPRRNPDDTVAQPGNGVSLAADRSGRSNGTGDAALDEAYRSEPALAKLQLLITRRLDGLLQGDYLGLLPGPGSEAGESREYRPGDDVRRMDWPVTARTTVPHVRQTVADRELEAWLAIDLSASLEFGTARSTKRDLVISAAAAIAHLTARGGNRMGAVIGSGSQLRRLPARPGRKETQGLLRAVAQTKVQPGVRHDLLAIEVLDPREVELPDAGVLEFVDAESGALHEIQTADPKLRVRYAEAAAAQRAAIAAAIRGAGAAHLRLRTDSDWLFDIVRFVAAQRHARTRGTTR